VLHDLLNVRRYVPELSMLDPVLSCIRSERTVSYRISVDFVVKVEEDAQAGMSKDGMCGFGENVIV
jgi:hypothetical protein